MGETVSFISIFQKIAKGLVAAEHVAAPVASIIFPQFAPIIGSIDHVFGTVQASIVTAEANNPVDGQGQLKLDAVVTDFNAAMADMQSFAAVAGKQFTYDGKALQDAISAQTQAYNAFAALKKSFKLADLPKTEAA